jgi:type III secretion system low calcium response chaperone LcrH/SycD
MSDSNSTPNVDEATVQALIEGLQEGATVKELKGVSDDVLEGIYAFAHRFYSNGQLEEAEAFFRFLCLYDFYNGEYALGLGAVHQMKGEYQRAIDMYALAYALLRADYRPMLHTGQCQLALGKVNVARECFDIVIAHSQDAAHVARATAYLQAIAQAAPLPEKEE